MTAAGCGLAVLGTFGFIGLLVFLSARGVLWPLEAFVLTIIGLTLLLLWLYGAGII